MKVRFAVLNLRLGGQVSSVLALARLLADRGIDAQLMLPRGLDAATPVALDRWARQPFARRMAAVMAMLLRTPERPDVLHLVVPSPSFAGIAAILPQPAHRILLQYEGPPLRLDPENLRDLSDAPLFVAPRLILNNMRFASLGQGLPCHHLATHPLIAHRLRDLGFDRVHEVPNVLAPPPRPLWPGTMRPGKHQGMVRVGYIGHAHRVKGIFDLLCAFDLVAHKRPDLELVLALTSDGAPDRVARLVGAAPWRDRVTIFGIVDTSQLLGRLDALALPYRSMLTTTLYPSLLVEAAEARCPVIVSDLPELAPVLRGSPPALYRVPPRCPKALAKVLEGLGPRDDLGFRPFLELPDVSCTVDALIAIYSDLAARRP